MKCSFRIWILVSFVLFYVDGKERCQKCLPADQCIFYGNLNAEQQERWIDRFECPKSKKANSDLFGFASRAKGDVICCPDNIWGLNGPKGFFDNNFNDDLKFNSQPDLYPQVESKNNLNRRSYDYDRPVNDYTNFQPNNFYPYNSDVNLEPQRWNPRPRYRQGLNGGWANNQGFNRNLNGGFSGNLRQIGNRNDQGFNGNQGFNRNENPYFNSGNENVVATNQREQCPLSSFPPNPETGCCGKEATAENRYGGSQYAPAKTFPVPSRRKNNWAPRRSSPSSQDIQTGWDSLWNPMDDFETYMPRFTRETKVNVTIGTRIAGGKETELEEYPWTVLLKTTFDYGTRLSSFNCGGSVISSRYILTAAHCVVEENARVKDVEVYLAEYDKRTFPRDCKNVLGVGQKCVENIIMHAEQVIPHPKYDDNRLYNDIALIRLRGAAPYTDYIRPICLPPINIDDPDLFNLRLAVAGWGRNGKYKSNIKQSTVVNLVPNSECKQFYPSLTKAHLCAAGYSGEDTCKGDSGGPLMILYEGKYYVSGVVSGKRADAPCGTSVPSLYTNVYQFLPWIRSNIRG